MNEGPKVNDAGASVEAATEYVTYADEEASYVARSLFSIQWASWAIQVSNTLGSPSDSNWWPCPRQFLEVLETLIRSCDIQEVRRKCEELQSVQSSASTLEMSGAPYDIPNGAGSRAAAFVGADAGTVYVTVAL
jgi:hypothetical protein